MWDPLIAKQSALTSRPGSRPQEVVDKMLTPFEEELVVGSRFADRFQILGVVGRGSMGIVYQARHELMHRQVAIKMLRGQLQSDERSMRRFEREARAASRMDHPNLIAVHDFGLTQNRQPYLVMEFVQGSTLYDIQKRENHLTPVRAVRIFTQVCDALQHAHVQGVIHRDLKPSNIMIIEKDGEGDFVKVFDLGIAKIAWGEEEDKEPLTNTNEVCGSPIYLSPEQCKHQVLDARSDIYSLGVVMYELLTGFPPLMGETVYDTIYMHVHEEPRSFSDIRPELHLPSRLERIVLKALAKNVEDRYQSMQELKWELQASLQASDPHLKVLPPDQLTPRRNKALEPPADSAEYDAQAARIGARTPTPGRMPVLQTANKTPSSNQATPALSPAGMPAVEPKRELSVMQAALISSAATTLVILAVAAIFALTVHKSDAPSPPTMPQPSAAGSLVPAISQAPSPRQMVANSVPVTPRPVPQVQLVQPVQSSAPQVAAPVVSPAPIPAQPVEHSAALHMQHGKKAMPNAASIAAEKAKQQHLAKQKQVLKQHQHTAPVAVAHQSKSGQPQANNGSMPFWGFFPGWRKPAAGQTGASQPPASSNATAPELPRQSATNQLSEPAEHPAAPMHTAPAVHTATTEHAPAASSLASGAPDEAVRLNEEGRQLTQSNPAAAIQKFRAALTSYPAYDIAKLNMGRAYVNYGNRLHDAGNDREAERQYQAAMEIFNQYHTPEAMRALQTAKTNYENVRSSSTQ
jgi:serine/threonine-protein kinase